MDNLPSLNNVYRSNYQCDRVPATCLSKENLQQRIVSIVDIPMQLLKCGENSFYIVANAASAIFSLIIGGCTVSGVLPCLASCLYVFVPLLTVGILIGVPINIGIEVIKKTYCIAMDVLGIIFPNLGRNMRLGVVQEQQNRDAAQAAAAQRRQPATVPVARRAPEATDAGEDPTGAQNPVLYGLNAFQSFLATAPQRLMPQSDNPSPP